MSISTRPSSPSLSLSPRLMWCLRVIRLSSKRAQLLQIYLRCSTSILCLVTLISLYFLSYGFALMVLCLLALGFYLGYIVSFLTPLRVIPCVLVAQHPGSCWCPSISNPGNWAMEIRHFECYIYSSPSNIAPGCPVSWSVHSWPPIRQCITVYSPLHPLIPYLPI